METDVGWGKQTLIEMLLCNVMSGVFYTARLNIALGRHSWKQVRSEQSLSAQTGKDVGSDTPIWPRAPNLIQLKLSEQRAAEGEKRKEMNP